MKPLKSRTIWVNAITGIIGVVTMYNGVIPPEWCIPALAVANIALRYITTGPIK
jgi:hypothetical protein